MAKECTTCRLLRELLESAGVSPSIAKPVSQRAGKTFEKKVKRKASAYSMKYAKAFKKVQSKYKTKAGRWKKDGFKRAQKAAHAMAKRMR